MAICRDWFKAMEEGALAVLRPMLPSSLQSAAAELAPYWTDSFGNKTRIDYGEPLRYLPCCQSLNGACVLCGRIAHAVSIAEDCHTQAASGIKLAGPYNISV